MEWVARNKTFAEKWKLLLFSWKSRFCSFECVKCTNALKEAHFHFKSWTFSHFANRRVDWWCHRNKFNFYQKFIVQRIFIWRHLQIPTANSLSSEVFFLQNSGGKRKVFCFTNLLSTAEANKMEIIWNFPHIFHHRNLATIISHIWNVKNLEFFINSIIFFLEIFVIFKENRTFLLKKQVLCKKRERKFALLYSRSILLVFLL